MLYRHVFDKISTEFCGIFRVFVNFWGFRGFTWISQLHDRAKYQKPCKLWARNEPRNLESKRCWCFYAMSAERYKTMYFKTLNPRLFNLRQWFEVRFFSVVICKCCQFSMSLLSLYMWEFWMELKKKSNSRHLLKYNKWLNITRLSIFWRNFWKLNKKRMGMNSVDLLYWNNLYSGPSINVA